MKTFSKKLKDILLLMGMVAFTIPTFATTADAGADKTLNVTPSKKAVYLKGSGTGDAPLTYKWYEGTKFIGGGAGRWYRITQSGEHNITLVVTDANGIDANDTMRVTVNKATANAGADQEINGTSVHLEGTGTGKAPLNYKWYENSTFIGAGSSYDYEISQNGQHTITLVVTDANGAKATDKMIVTVNNGEDNTTVTANAGLDQELNVTASNRAVYLKGSGTGKAPLSYKWYEGSKYIGAGSSRWYVITQKGQHEITLVVNDANGNEANDTMIVTSNAGISNVEVASEVYVPTVPVNNPNALCQISFELGYSSDVEMIVAKYNDTNQIVFKKKFISLPQGKNTITWNGKRADGKYILAGAYKVGIRAVDSDGSHSATVYTIQEIFY